MQCAQFFESAHNINLTLRNNERYKTAIRRLSENTYFFPAYSMFNFACNETNACLFGYKNEIGTLERRMDQDFKYGLQVSEQDEDDVAENRLVFSVRYIGSDKREASCFRGFGESKDHISVVLPLDDEERPRRQLDLGSCAPKCIATTMRSKICSNENKVVDTSQSGPMRSRKNLSAVWVFKVLPTSHRSATYTQPMMVVVTLHF